MAAVLDPTPENKENAEISRLDKIHKRRKNLGFGKDRVKGRYLPKIKRAKTYKASETPIME